MNLFSIANAAIQVIDKNIPATWRKSTGWADNPNHTRTPQYEDTEIEVSVQPLSSDDLQHVDGLNIQGEKRAIWMYGDVQAVGRSEERGGDLLVFEQHGKSQTWKVVQVVESCPEWSHVIAVLQLDETT